MWPLCTVSHSAANGGGSSGGSGDGGGDGGGVEAGAVANSSGRILGGLPHHRRLGADLILTRPRDVEGTRLVFLSLRPFDPRESPGIVWRDSGREDRAHILGSSPLCACFGAVISYHDRAKVLRSRDYTGNAVDCSMTACV